MSESTTATPTLQRTPLYPRLKETPARWTDFGGWEMPVEFTGILKEHRAVRSAAGLFDLCHMGELEVRGGSVNDAVGFVQRIVTNDVSRMEPGACMYSVVCKDDGGILDDVIVYRHEHHVMLVVNASNREKILAWLLEKAAPGIEIVDRTFETALIALQGPLAEAILRPLTAVDLPSLAYYHFVEGSVAGIEGILSRTGYTGEDGFEMYVPAEAGIRLWDALTEAGQGHGLLPIGLGARDTLRLEARYALYGHEIDENTNPYEAGLGWVVKLAKGDFVGREALERIKAEGVRRTLVGLAMEDRGVPRQGFPVTADGREIGAVTSGTFSPTLEHAIALAYVEKSAANHHVVGAAVDVQIRKAACRARVVKTPFHRGSVKS